VLEKNLFDVPNTDIHKVKVMQTMLDGKFVYDRESEFEKTSSATR
jgi:predicted amidohydrolase YtcJ